MSELTAEEQDALLEKFQESVIRLYDLTARLAAVEALADGWEQRADAADRGEFSKRERWVPALRERAREVRGALHPERLAGEVGAE